MKRLAPTLLALLASAGASLPLHAQGPQSPLPASPVHLGFEEGESGQAPAGWRLSAPSGYRFTTSAERPRSGRYCAELSREPAAGGQGFGSAAQAFSAQAFRGKRVRFRAAVRADAGKAQLWMRVDRALPGGVKPGFFDNMADRPIGELDWRHYEIVGDVDEDASAIVIGLLMPGAGRAWIDDASFEVVGDAVKRVVEPPRPLSARGLENVRAFARLVGYVRHFHPSDEAARADWDALAVEGMRQVESARDARELARILEAFFRPLAPSLRVFAAGRAPAAARPSRARPAPAVLKVVMWRHVGFWGPERDRELVGLPRGRLFQALENGRPTGGFADPEKPFQADLGGGVSCLLPLALYADGSGTLPRAAVPAPRASGLAVTRARYSAEDRATRLAAAALAWNVLQHFYPYFDAVPVSWPGELTKALASAAVDADEPAFTLTLERMVAALDDGHGRVVAPAAAPRAALPLAWDWVEGQLVITAAGPGAGLSRGDVVHAIGGRPAAQALAEEEALVSGATPRWKRWLALRHLWMGPKDESVTLEVESAGEPPGRRSITLKRDAPPNSIREPRPEKVTELEPGFFYVDLTRISSQDLEAALPRLEPARGIVFDVRGHPSRLDPYRFFGPLSESVLTSAQWHVPIVTRPDREGMAFERHAEWQVAPRPPHLKARKAFVTDASAISAAESFLGIVEHHKLGAIVGEPTAGTNGDVCRIDLPGGYSVHFTQLKVLKHDGSRHHGVGIRPDVPASRTRKGVAAGRDELLERAVQAIKE